MSETANQKRKTSVARWLMHLFLAVVAGGTIIAAVMTVAPFAARWHFSLELLSNFPLQLAVLTLLASVCFGVAFRWKWLAFALLLCLTNCGFILLSFSGASEVKPVGPVYRIASINVLTSNRNYDAFVEFIRLSKPDVFLVMEIDTGWTAALQRLHKTYPHSVVNTRDDNFGIGLFSRLPILEHQVVGLGTDSLPTIVADIKLKSGPVRIIGTHPLPPMRRAAAHSRNSQLKDVAGWVDSEPTILLGDLNTTPYSPHFRELLADCALRDSRPFCNVQPSWPTRLPWLMRLPIDHVLVSKEVHIADRFLGPDIGSDHYPVVVEFRMRR